DHGDADDLDIGAECDRAGWGRKRVGVAAGARARDRGRRVWLQVSAKAARFADDVRAPALPGHDAFMRRRRYVGRRNTAATGCVGDRQPGLEDCVYRLIATVYCDR